MVHGGNNVVVKVWLDYCKQKTNKWRWREASNGAIVSEVVKGKEVVHFGSNKTERFYNGKWLHKKKKIQGLPMCFLIPDLKPS